MKKGIVIIAGLLLAVSLTGCSKSTKCKCVAKEAVDAQGRPQITFIDVRGMSCSKLTHLGTERLLEGELVREMEVVTCEKTNEAVR